MPKTVTEEDLAAGMKGLGGFGAISAKRDSPFRDSRAVKPAEAKTVEIKPAVETVPMVQPAEANEPQVKPATVEVPKPGAIRPAPTPREVSKPKAKQSQRKADIHSERVTLQISAKMRDEVDELARQLQRAKTSKDERITANTVMRVAIRLLTENFKMKSGDGPNNEEELYRLAEQVLRR